MVPKEVVVAIRHLNRQYTSGQLDNDELFGQVCIIVSDAKLDGATIKEAICFLLPGPRQIVYRRTRALTEEMRSKGLLPSQQKRGGNDAG